MEEEEKGKGEVAAWGESRYSLYWVHKLHMDVHLNISVGNFFGGSLGSMGVGLVSALT